MSVNPSRIALARDGVFHTIQGEGFLLGEPTVFIRVAGCPVGCPECDTDYRVAERLTAGEVLDRVQRLPRTEWVWLTGGEPTSQPIGRLVRGLRADGYKVAIATAGIAEADIDGWPVRECDDLSVSPHWLDSRWVLRGGTQVNLVFGLNGLRPEHAAGIDFRGFVHRWATPAHGDRAAVAECVEFVNARPGFRLGVQAHKVWGLA